jgi:hypothetical protein
MHVAGSESSFVMSQAFARSSTAILTGAMFALLVAGGCGESDEVSSNDDAGVTVDGGNGSPDAIDPASVPLVGEVLTPDTCPADSNRPGSGITPGNDLHRVTLDEYPEAVCNDGSPAIAYIRRAATPAAESTWVIFLQFGGACQSWEICRDRWCSYNTSYDAARMSSRFAPEIARANGLLSRDADNEFAAANQVLVYYCSSDQWTGRRGDVVLNDPEGVGASYRLHFQGFSIIEALDDALRGGLTSDDGAEVLPPLGDATRILFSGGSAGSAGQTHALDWWAGRYPDAEVAGFFDSSNDPVVDDIVNETVAADFEAVLPARHDVVFSSLYDAHLDESCMAAHGDSEPWLCSLGSHVRLNHITTPYFVRQDLRDPVTFNAFEQLGLSLEDYAVSLEATMNRFPALLQTAEERDAMTRAPGVYVSNCEQHIVALNNGWFGLGANPASVQNADGTPVSVHDALAAWINGETITVLDTQPSTRSRCLSTTDDQ